MTSAERGVEVRRRLLAAAAELIPLVGWRGVSTRVVAAPAATAAVLVAALDGVMLHRALRPAMTTGEIEPVLHRLLGVPGSRTSERERSKRR